MIINPQCPLRPQVMNPVKGEGGSGTPGSGKPPAAIGGGSMAPATEKLQPCTVPKRKLGPGARSEKDRKEELQILEKKVKMTKGIQLKPVARPRFIVYFGVGQVDNVPRCYKQCRVRITTLPVVRGDLLNNDRKFIEQYLHSMVAIIITLSHTHKL